MRDEPDGSVTQLEHRATGTRLGEGLHEAGDLAPPAMERTSKVAREFAEAARAMGASDVGCIATSAMRRASNAGAFAARLEREADLKLRILDGREEAAASFRGATYGVRHDGRRIAVLDIGGGSTECAVGRNGELESGSSLEIGSVRVTERFPLLDGRAHEGGDAAGIAKARDDAQTVAREVLASFAAYRPIDALVCVAGTPLTLGAVAFRRTVETVRGLELTRSVVDATVEQLLALDLESRRALPGMIPQRADVLPGGGIILSQAMATLGVDRGTLESNDLLLGFLVAN